MPISLRRWKQKATKYINEKFRATGQGTLNHDLKMYLDLSEFEPLFNGSVERINRGANEDQEIETVIRELARQTLSTAMEVGEEKFGGDSSSDSSSSSSSSSSSTLLDSSNTDIIQPNDVNYFHRHEGMGIHHHYYY